MLYISYINVWLGNMDNEQAEDRIDAFEMWIYRRIGRVSWTEKQTNKQVLGKLGMKKQLLREIKFIQVFWAHKKT